MAAWWESSGAGRLDHDKRIVAEMQPHLRHEVQPDGNMALVGDFVFVTRVGVEHIIPTRIDFPSAYPTQEPQAVEVGNRFAHEMDRHFNSDTGQCCLWLPAESEWSDDPDALRTFLDQLGLFYHRQVMLDAGATDVWPGHERGHGAQGYVDVLVELLGLPEDRARRFGPALAGRVSRNAPCPCGSRRRFRKCHQDIVARFIERTETNHLISYIMALDAAGRTSRKSS